MPRRASGFRYSGSKMMVERSDSTSPLWRGMPNFVGKSLFIWAIALIVASISAAPLSESKGYGEKECENQTDGGTGGTAQIIGHGQTSDTG